MSVSKRLRFEVLRRDNHTCRYCGGAAPDVKLTVDHVVPTALGGTDEPSNLVAACGPCNSGKTSSSPDAPVVADVEQDALRWSKAMDLAADMQAQDASEINGRLFEIDYSWFEQFAPDSELDEGCFFWPSDPSVTYKYKVQVGTSVQLFDSFGEACAWEYGERERHVPPMPKDWKTGASAWIRAGLTIGEACELMRVAARSKAPFESKWRYFCGCMWRRLEDRQAIARQLLTSEGGA